jgi:hypothetical protein
MATPGEKHRKAIDDVKIDLASVLAERLTAAVSRYSARRLASEIKRTATCASDQARGIGGRGKYRNNCPETR